MRLRSLTAVVSGLAVAVTGVATLGPTTSPAAAEPVAPPAVTADPRAEVLGINAVNVAGLVSVADVALGVSRNTVEGVDSNAYASNLETSLLGVDLPSILARVDQSAPPDNPDPMVAGGRSGALAPLLTLGVSESEAHARSAGEGLSCVAAGTPVATSSVDTANVRLLDVPLVGALLELPGTASTTSTTELVPNAATDVDGRDVVATATGSTAVVKLLGGNVEISVNEAPSLVATATGRPGGADVAFSAPVVTVKVGSRTISLNADGSPTDISLPPLLSTLIDLDISLGKVENLQESADGTTASASASVLHVDATLLAGAVRLLDLDLFPLTASATAPEGGAECPGIDAPAVTVPTDGAVTNDATPDISGTGEPGQTVAVVIDDVVRGTAPVGTDGTWTFVPGAPLAEGPHTVAASYGGLTSPEVDFTVDVTADAAPEITTPPDGSVTTDTTPDVTGNGAVGSEVAVSIDGTPVGTAVVGAGGTWTVPVTTPLDDGDHDVTATQTDEAGNVSPADAVTFTVDTTAPAAPAILSPVDGTATNDTTPTVSGTGEPGAEVEVSIDGTVVGTVEVDDLGNWAVTPTTPLADGPHTATATQTDTAGNTSPADESDFTVDTTAPDAPVITSPLGGSSTNDTTPTVSGTGEPGADVAVSIDGTVVGTAEVDADGAWSLTPTTPLGEGPHTVGAVQTDGASNTTPAAPVTFTVDTTTPGAPAIEAPADGSVTADASPTVSGTGEPGAVVTVELDGTPVGTVEVDDDGTWSLDLTGPLADGPHTVDATQADDAGNVSPADSVDFTVDTTAPGAPAITAPVDGSVTTDPSPTFSGTGEPGAEVEVVVDGAPVGTAPVDGDGAWTLTPAIVLADGPHTVDATQTDGAGNTSGADSVDFTVDATAPGAPVVTAPGDGDLVTDSTPEVTGTGEPGATVSVEIDGTVVGTDVVDADGTWSVTPTTPLGEGPHTVEATQTDEAGNTSPADTVDFTVDTTAPGAPAVTAPADGAAVADTTPEVTGTGEPGATVSVEIDGTVVGTDVVDADGTWSVTPTTPLGEGPHTVEATQTDEAGNTSPADTVDFTVDTTAPDAPVITAPADGATLTSSSPTVTGTGEAGATVTVTVDGRPVGTAVVGGDGRWSLVPNVPLASGERVIAATQADRAGNVSPADSITVTVQVNPDLDGDGLSNDEETRIGTDPRNPDTDGDGLTDGDEVRRYGTNPLNRDTDADRLPDGQEVLYYRTNPLNADTDRDGIGDGHEVLVTGTRPQFADTDNDGLGDGAELVGFRMNQGVVYRPNRAYRLDLVRTNPLRKDTDGDGLQDRAEVYGVNINQNVRLVRGSYVIGVRKSDPNHPDTDRDGLTDAQEVTGSANVRFNRRKTDPTHFDTDRGGRMDGEEVRGRFDPSDAYSGPNSGR